MPCDWGSWPSWTSHPATWDAATVTASTTTISVTHEDAVQALRALFARSGSPQLVRRHRNATGRPQHPPMATTTVHVTRQQRDAALRSLFARAGSPRLGPPRLSGLGR